MKRWELSILIGLVLAILMCSMTGFTARCAKVRESSIRLHILANSNSAEDQTRKLLVRDAVLQTVGKTLSRAKTKEEAVLLARQNLTTITKTANDTLRANGCNDTVHAEVTNLFFATRTYGNVVMPAGRYDAVRITLGSGKGNNWWCVMFPPLCLPAAEKKNGAPANAAQALLIGDQPEYEIKFAVVEAYEALREKWTQHQTLPKPKTAQQAQEEAAKALDTALEMPYNAEG